MLQKDRAGIQKMMNLHQSNSPPSYQQAVHLTSKHAQGSAHTHIHGVKEGHTVFAAVAPGADQRVCQARTKTGKPSLDSSTQVQCRCSLLIQPTFHCLLVAHQLSSIAQQVQQHQTKRVIMLHVLKLLLFLQHSRSVSFAPYLG